MAYLKILFWYCSERLRKTARTPIRITGLKPWSAKLVVA
jgi:hypothetical protein